MAKKKIFNFNGEMFNLLDLFHYHISGLNYFKEGDVVDTIDGNCFDISDIFNQKQKYHEEFINTVDKLGDLSSRNIANAMYKDEKEVLKKRLNKRYDKRDISLEELELLLKLESDTPISKNYYVGMKDSGTYYRKYHKFKYPETLSITTIGRFTLLLDFMTYSNTIKRTSRENSNFPTADELMSFMRIENVKTLNRTLKELKDNRIINYRRENGKKIIYINPLCSERNLKIHPEIYRMFKDELDEVLSDKDKLYLNMLTFGDENSATLTILE